MPLIESAANAVTRVYARSLFELVLEKAGPQGAESVLAELEDLLEIARSEPRIGEFFASRLIPTEKRAASLKKALQGRVSDMTLQFLLVLNERDRLQLLPSVVAGLDSIVQERFGRVEADVHTAEPLEHEQVVAIRERLSSILGKEVIVHPYTDARMIGGIKIKIGDQLLDASLESRLRAVREQLVADGAVRLRARIDRVVEN